MLITTPISQEQVNALEMQRESLGRSLQQLETDLSGKGEALKNIEARLTSFQTDQKNHRLAVTALTCLALASLGWQIAQYFL